MKKLKLTALFIGVLTMTACGADTSAPEQTKVEDSKPKVAQSTPKIEPESSEQEVKASVLSEEKVLGTLRENFSGQGEIILVKNTFYFVPNEDFATLFELIEKGEFQEEWEDVKKSQAMLSETIAEALGEGYRIAIVDSIKIEKMILISENGKNVFDFAENQGGI